MADVHLQVKINNINAISGMLIANIPIHEKKNDSSEKTTGKHLIIMMLICLDKLCIQLSPLFLCHFQQIALKQVL